MIMRVSVGSTRMAMIRWVSILAGVEVVIEAEDVPMIAVVVVVAELTLWMASKSQQAIVIFVPVVMRW